MISFAFINFFSPPLSSENCSFQFFEKNLFNSPLTLSRLKKYNENICSFLKENKENFEIVSRFVRQYVECIDENSSEEVFDYLTDLLSLDFLKSLSSTESLFESNEESSKQAVFDLRKRTAASLYLPLPSWWKKTRLSVVSFVPNLFNIFVEAFSFLDASKQFTSLWDKYLIINITCQFFLIPSILITALKPFIATTFKVYLTTALILFVSLSSLTIYQQNFKGCPDHIVNCRNLDEKIELGFIPPVFSRQRLQNQQIVNEHEELIAKLLGGSNVLIVAKSGEGKTALIHEIVQAKKNKQLPAQLQKLNNHELDCRAVISNASFAHCELINRTKEQIKNHEEKILMFVDEIDHLTKNPLALDAFKKQLLEETPHPLIIATTTDKGYAKIVELDLDQSFRSRFSVIVLTPSLDEQIHLILKEYSQREAADSLITEEAIDKIVELSKDNSFLKEVGRPRKALNILKNAIGECRANVIKLERNDIKSKSISKIKQLIRSSNYFKKQLKYFQEELTQMSFYSKPLRSFKQKKYLFSSFYLDVLYPCLMKKYLKEVEGEPAIQITSDLVKNVFAKTQQTHASLNTLSEENLPT